MEKRISWNPSSQSIIVMTTGNHISFVEIQGNEEKGMISSP
jgi:hypothetical protein